MKTKNKSWHAKKNIGSQWRICWDLRHIYDTSSSEWNQLFNAREVETWHVTYLYAITSNFNWRKQNARKIHEEAQSVAIEILAKDELSRQEMMFVSKLALLVL